MGYPETIGPNNKITKEYPLTKNHWSNFVRDSRNPSSAFTSTMGSYYGTMYEGGSEYKVSISYIQKNSKVKITVTGEGLHAIVSSDISQKIFNRIFHSNNKYYSKKRGNK